MSGGVDSSVAAALLKKQGYDVFGVFFHFWGEEIKGSVRDNICCSLESQEDARKVAQKLDMKFYTINVSAEFKKNIVEDFISEYKDGHTPNPCVRCNKYIKFGEALEKVKKLGADYLATGHYCQIKEKSGKFYLLKGNDKDKDQTYFLHQLTQNQLSHVMFPVGKFKKKKVRKIAAKFDLPTAGKRESQEVCFIPDGDIESFLRRHISMEDGEIKNIETTEVVGTHNGLQQYTIGQRKGLGLQGGPWFVAKIDAKQNILWVADKLELIFLDNLELKNVNWIPEEVKLPINVRCSIRYTKNKAKAVVFREDGKIKVKFSQPQKSITPGQSAVFWQGKKCLGGGVIV